MHRHDDLDVEAMLAHMHSRLECILVEPGRRYVRSPERGGDCVQHWTESHKCKEKRLAFPKHVI